MNCCIFAKIFIDMTIANNQKRTVFNEAQLYLLEVFSRVKTQKELNDIKRLVSNYYFNKLEKELDKFEVEKKSCTKKKTVKRQ